MHSLIREVTKNQKRKVPEIRTGYTVAVHQKIKEGTKERIQIFEGLVIKVSHGEGSEKTFTVRKIVAGIGVEKLFPIHSPNLAKVVVKKKAKVRRAKLYYMRQRFGKSARLQERHVTAQERAEEEARLEASIQDAVVADENKKAEEIEATPAPSIDSVEVVKDSKPTEAAFDQSVIESANLTEMKDANPSKEDSASIGGDEKKEESAE